MTVISEASLIPQPAPNAVELLRAAYVALGEQRGKAPKAPLSALRIDIDRIIAELTTGCITGDPRTRALAYIRSAEACLDDERDQRALIALHIAKDEVSGYV